MSEKNKEETESTNKNSGEEPKKEKEEEIGKGEEIQMMFQRAPTTLTELRNKHPSEIKFGLYSILTLALSYILLFTQRWYLLGGLLLIYLITIFPMIDEHKDDWKGDTEWIDNIKSENKDGYDWEED